MRAASSARRWIGQLGVFAIVGVLNTLVDIALFWLLTAIAGIAPIPANIVSFSAGAICSFMLNGRLTFRAGASAEKRGARALRFAVTTLVTLAASTACIALLIPFIPPMAAKLLSVGVSFAIGFLLQRNWVFAGPRIDPAAAGESDAAALAKSQPDTSSISQ